MVFDCELANLKRYILDIFAMLSEGVTCVRAFLISGKECTSKRDPYDRT